MKKNFRFSLTILLLVATSFVVSGCIGKLNKSYPERREFLILAERPDEAPQHSGAKLGNLLVRPFQISPIFEKKHFTVSPEPNVVEADFYNQFYILPARNIMRVSFQWLNDSGAFDKVIDISSILQADYILEGNVPKLYGDYSGNMSKAVLEVQYSLLKRNGSDFEIVFHKTYLQESKMPEKTATALVKGWSAAFVSILTELEKDIIANTNAE